MATSKYLASTFKEKTSFGIVPNPGQPGLAARVCSHPFEARIAYPSGNFIIVRSIADPTDCFVYKGHSSPTVVAKFSPNGDWIASGDLSGKVRIWSWEDPEHLTKLEAKVFAGKVASLDWDGESRKIMVVGDEGTGSRSLCKTINFEVRAEPLEQTPNPLKKPPNLTVFVSNHPSPIAAARDGSPRDLSTISTMKQHQPSPQKDDTTARTSLYSYETPHGNSSRVTSRAGANNNNNYHNVDALSVSTLNPNPDEVRGFDINREVLGMINMPQLDPTESSIKNRIAAVEDSVNVQAKVNAVHAELFNDLDGDLAKVQAFFPAALQQLYQRHNDDIGGMRSEFEHKFELQAAENLRMQQHIVTLKAENEIFKRKLDEVLSQMRRVQVELDHDIPPDTTTGALSGNFSIPLSSTSSRGGGGGGGGGGKSFAWMGTGPTTPNSSSSRPMST